MKRSTLLAAMLLPAASLSAYVPIGAKAPVPVTAQDGSISYSSKEKELKLDPETAIDPGTVVSFPFHFSAAAPNHRWIRFSTGEKTFLRIQMSADGREIRFQGSAGRLPALKLNPVYNRRFSWNDTLLGWTAILSERFQKEYSKDRWTLSAELLNGELMLSLNGLALGTLPVPEKTLEITIPREVALYPPEVRKTNPLFRPLDIAFRFNADKIGEETPSVPASDVTLGGVPFRLSAPNGKFNHIDAGLSWLREGGLPESYEEPHQGSFGGRWAGAFSNNPTRIQFSIPNAPYNAVYLLCAASGEENTIPRLTAQFYRRAAGFPKSFSSPDVPLYSSDAAVTKLPIANGRNLYLVRIPVRPGMLQEFSNSKILEMELTKDVKTYRAYPDPWYYSAHGAGLPSGVRVFALTLGVAPVSVDFRPDAYANIFPEDTPVSYTATLRNNTDHPQTRTLTLNASAFQGNDKLQETKKADLAPGETKDVKFTLTPKLFGHYTITLSSDGDMYERSFARPRKRPHNLREFNTPGHMFGFWNWQESSHGTIPAEEVMRIMGPAGAESYANGALDPASVPLMEKYGMRLYFAFENSGADVFTISYFTKLPPNDAKAKEQLLAVFRKKKQEKSSVRDPQFVRFFAEPGAFNSHGTMPEYYGEAPEDYTKTQEANWKREYRLFRLAAEAVFEVNPSVKLIMPHGNPNFAIPFLQQNTNLTKRIQGCAVDLGYFERLPEQQFHQCSLHRMVMVNDAFRKAGNEKPLHVSLEGPCLAPVMPGALSGFDHAAHIMRSMLILSAYHVTRQFAVSAPVECSDWWGEQHYAGGLVSRPGALNPHPAYAAYAAVTRHLRTMDFAGWIPTGSGSLYCLKFHDAAAEKNMYAVWTVTGKRSVTFKNLSGPAERFDAMDNADTPEFKDGAVTFPVSELPCFVYAQGDIQVVPGESDHSDSVLAENRLKLGNASELFPKQTQNASDGYLNNFPDCIRRFPARMTVEPVDRPDGKALTVTLPKQAKSRGVMPFFTTLEPKEPVEIPGRPARFAFRVKAHSDWGRVVYVLRDAKGEEWISVGPKGQWNSDDITNSSVFRFDGARWLKTDIPSNSPWDKFIDMNMASWGSANGDRVVDFPVSLVRIHIERREDIMYVNSLEKASPESVELGDLYAEYDTKEEMSPDAAAKRNLAMPAPDASALPNPVAALAEKADPSLEASEILKVEHPASWNDGTRGVFTFREMPAAAKYDVYLSMHEDGRGALKLGNGLKKSGVEVRGFRAGVPFYAFLVWFDRKGKQSPVSKAFRFQLDSQFGMK